jgi:hypothetical protein
LEKLAQLLAPLRRQNRLQLLNRPRRSQKLAECRPALYVLMLDELPLYWPTVYAAHNFLGGIQPDAMIRVALRGCCVQGIQQPFRAPGNRVLTA